MENLETITSWNSYPAVKGLKQIDLLNVPAVLKVLKLCSCRTILKADQFPLKNASQVHFAAGQLGWSNFLIWLFPLQTEYNKQF
jgi:hypothetical protein